jgi:hypothetical protein
MESFEKNAQNHLKPRLEEGADYFARLGVSPDASRSEISASFRKLSQQLHPDVEGGGDLKKMQLLSEAYTHLKDDDQRMTYRYTIQRPQHENRYSTHGRSSNREDTSRTTSRSWETPEAIRKTAAEAASEWPDVFKKYVDNIKFLKNMNVADADKLIESEEVVQAILAAAISKLRTPSRYSPEGPSYRRASFTEYMDRWATVGFDRKKFDENSESIAAKVVAVSLEEAETSGYDYSRFISKCVEEMGFDRTKADTNPELVALIQKQLLSLAKFPVNSHHKDYEDYLRDARSYSSSFSSYARSWKESPNIDIKRLINSPEIVKLVKKATGGIRLMHLDSYLRDFRDLGMDV